ncbi:hypothetical protein DAPPUDRAFT_301633 [Daphnia pulex]|uniref:Uncharacterized protein n=1 Tax=Daphnia pulex TaxID=6669 RepID=E9G9V2_DAPPU|nr:hypothetical protein DAPPUDRAFT_301633 [Daphnia pulex]|eukprot:EFX83632.1 hypothetical protein DAPPUDRAFT_301633 [Daphnia pulex]
MNGPSLEVPKMFCTKANIFALIEMLLIPLEVGTVLDKIDEILNRYDINWKSLLLIVSAIQVCYPTGSKYLKAFINSFMQRALDNLQMDLLLASFLLARQINAENTSSPHYGAWFSSITSSLTTSKQFAFLLKFLTNIVRHEPAWVLLAHKNNPPVIPMVDNCRNLWTDYSALIRTRIEDFKVNQSSNQVVEEDSNLVKEVDTAIAAFEKSDRRNRRIPSSVIEAAIFRKPYFVNKFLSVLLKPRRVPDPSDIREEFIEELRKSGKLPLVQYEAYCTACRKLGQIIPEIEKMDWQEPEGNPSYKTLMNQIVLCNETRQQSMLFEHLDSLLGTLRCYGVVIFLLSHNSHILLPVHYQAFEGAFSILLMDEDQLSMNREDSIPFHLRLLYYTVTEAKRQNELSSVRLPSVLYLWLSRRIFHSKMMPQYKQYLALSEDVEFRKETKLPLRNWLKLEMTVEADMDVLSWSERPGYLHSVLQMDYQNIHMTELYPIILDSIIERHNSIGRADCSKDLLLLLQSLLCKDQPTSTSDSSAWLIQYWLQLRLKKGNSVDQILWSVVCCLPPYLLSRNYYSQPAQQPTLKTLVNLIENDWRNTLTSESAWFPKSIASHLLRALEGTSSQDIPCLQFSAQIHAIHDARVASGPWKTLDKALNTFHPLLCDPQNAETIRWSGLTEVDLLACQLMALTAVVWCAKGITAELPLFIKELGPNISRNPNLMKAWKITFWTGDDCTMPWKKIIPTYMLNLLPFVILRSLISWSDVLLLTASDYLDALVTAHNQWNQTTRSFIDLASEHDNQSQADYPAGNILDLYTLGRLGSDVKHILKRAPLHTLKTFKQSSCFRSMETDYQEIVREKC